ncbi:SHOCT domain-containing protein [Nonomuraea sp. KC401]|uniref:SHOCT domain-containing protein n=1 Tax=Nonomuraea longispora TaxID=1848320 RepID=A0A4R4MVP9_9ACTN|nr:MULTISPECIES: SHOCT domain-containing protein [Nonomuraea]NBE96680.1 SHOCT domain-containing protein [Nonomuraea sp. K271]TDB99423.1 SHOCT domain-containing protein [Nonomuraea longispora]TLF67958.1 SHOCT domain-containing protein [Nonomuraea sp. KC401]
MNTIALLAPHWGGSGAFWPIFPLFWGLFWVGVVALAIIARRKGWWGPRRAHPAGPPGHAGPAGPAGSPTASAEQILAERYARGEMSDDEYFEKLSVLKGGTS